MSDDERMTNVKCCGGCGVGMLGTDEVTSVKRMIDEGYTEFPWKHFFFTKPTPWGRGESPYEHENGFKVNFGAMEAIFYLPQKCALYFVLNFDK